MKRPYGLQMLGDAPAIPTRPAASLHPRGLGAGEPELLGQREVTGAARQDQAGHLAVVLASDRGHGAVIGPSALGADPLPERSLGWLALTPPSPSPEIRYALGWGLQGLEEGLTKQSPLPGGDPAGHRGGREQLKALKEKISYKINFIIFKCMDTFTT